MTNQANFPTSLDTQIASAASADGVVTNAWNTLMDIAYQAEVKVGIDESPVSDTLDWSLTSAGSYDPGHRHTILSMSAASLSDTTGVCAHGDEIAFQANDAILFRGVSYTFPQTTPLCGKTLVYTYTGMNSASLTFYPEEILAVKQSDETSAGSTNFVTDSDLSLGVQASTNYLLKGCLIFTGGVTSDCKYSWSYPTGTVIRYGNFARLNLIDAGTTTEPGELHDQTDSVVVGLGGVSQNVFIPFYGTVKTDTTTGSIAIMWAQNAASATDLTLKAGSWISLAGGI